MCIAVLLERGRLKMVEILRARNCRLLSLVYWIVSISVICDSASGQDDANTKWCDFNSTSSGDWLDPGDESKSSPTECLPLDDYNLQQNVFDVCEPFLRNSCYMYDYGLNFVLALSELGILNTALSTSGPAIVRKECRDVIRAFVCNYYYIGCNPRTRQPQGICRESCIEYVQKGDCAASFDWLINFAAKTEGRFVFTPDCNDPLWKVKVDFPATENVTLDQEGCIDMSEVVENPIIEPKTTTDKDKKHHKGNDIDELIVAITVTIIVIIALIAGALLIVLIFYILRVKRKQTMRQNNMGGVSSELNNYRINNPHPLSERRGSVVSDNYDSVGNFKLTPEDISILSEDLRNTLIPFEHVKITGDLGEGAFGCVYKGILTKEMESGTDEVGVAIKTIKNHSEYHELKDFLKESSIMCSFSHPNVLGMEGICFDPNTQSPYLILPFMRNGDLKSYLKKKRSITQHVDVSYPKDLDHNTLLGICYQIACGMTYLASRKLVHRDLAARNCMIDRDFSVKVADFGLTRDIYQKDYYRQSSKRQIPVKWMSPESLVDRISNEKTDVWSFGITCWEVFSLGRAPYPTIDNSEMIDYLIDGHRLGKPDLCKDQLYEIMLLCWKDDPDERPHFETLSNVLRSILSDTSDSDMLSSSVGDSYVDMSSSVFCFSENPDSNASMAQTVFPNHLSSLSDYRNNGRENYRQQEQSLRLSSLQFSKHTPSVPSPLLHSTSYDIPHSIPRESFLQYNLSTGSAASLYLDMAPIMLTPARLTTLEELSDD